jgi:hypothetical protein
MANLSDVTLSASAPPQKFGRIFGAGPFIFDASHCTKFTSVERKRESEEKQEKKLVKS